jgi:hypothetical protein
MKWVTWEDIGVDRMACIWLIRRFIDPKAEFLFIPAGGKPLPKGAEPFDIPRSAAVAPPWALLLPRDGQCLQAQGPGPSADRPDRR